MSSKLPSRTRDISLLLYRSLPYRWSIRQPETSVQQSFDCTTAVQQVVADIYLVNLRSERIYGLHLCAAVNISWYVPGKYYQVVRTGRAFARAVGRHGLSRQLVISRTITTNTGSSFLLTFPGGAGCRLSD